MNVAATLGLLGVPPTVYLDSTDREERLLLTAVAQRAIQLEDDRQRNQAAYIVQALAKALR